MKWIVKKLKLACDCLSDEDRQVFKCGNKDFCLVRKGTDKNGHSVEEFESYEYETPDK